MSAQMWQLVIKIMWGCNSVHVHTVETSPFFHLYLGSGNDALSIPVPYPPLHRWTYRRWPLGRLWFATSRPTWRPQKRWPRACSSRAPPAAGWPRPPWISAPRDLTPSSPSPWPPSHQALKSSQSEIGSAIGTWIPHSSALSYPVQQYVQHYWILSPCQNIAVQIGAHTCTVCTLKIYDTPHLEHDSACIVYNGRAWYVMLWIIISALPPWPDTLVSWVVYTAVHIICRLDVVERWHHDRRVRWHHMRSVFIIVVGSLSSSAFLVEMTCVVCIICNVYAQICLLK